MDVELPNGVVIKDVPDGTTKDEIRRRAVFAGLAKPEDFPSREPIDVEANRRVALKEFGKTLSPVERFGIGVREPIATAGAKLDRLIGKPNEEVERGLEYSREVGGVAAGVGRAVPAIATLGRVPAGIVPSALAGGAYGAATSEDAASGATAGAIGGAAGSMLAAGAGRAVNGIVGNWATRTVKGSDDLVKTLDDFQKLGGRLTPGAATGGRATQFADDALSNNPLTATPYAAIEKNNQTVLNKTLSRALGITGKADEIGPSALRAADDVINQEFNAVASQLPVVPLQAGSADDIADLLSARTVKPFLAKLQSGQITGRDYMDLRSKLLEITRRQGSDKVDDAWEAIEALDDAAEAVAPASYKPAYAAARERFKTLLSVDKYRRSVTGGDANALTLEGAVRSVFKKQYTRDAATVLPETSDLFTALRAMSDPRLTALTGGSPTAKRLMPLLTAGALGGGAYANPAIAGAVAGGAVLGSRGYLAAPASAAVRKAGGVAGTAAGLQAQREKPARNQ